MKKFIAVLLLALLSLGNIISVLYNLLRLIDIEKLKDNFEILLKNDKAVFALISVDSPEVLHSFRLCIQESVWNLTRIII